MFCAPGTKDYRITTLTGASVGYGLVADMEMLSPVTPIWINNRPPYHEGKWKTNMRCAHVELDDRRRWPR